MSRPSPAAISGLVDSRECLSLNRVLLTAALALSLSLGSFSRAGATGLELDPANASIEPGGTSANDVDGEIHPVCLIGEWHVVDLTTYFRSAVHVGNVESADGPYYWTFRQDGTFSQNADATVVATSTAGDNFVERMLLVSAGNFRDSLDMVLTFSNVTTAGNVDVTVNGEPFIQGADPGGLAVSDTSHASYACDGDRLTLQPDFGDGRVAMMNLQRHHGS